MSHTYVHHPLSRPPRGLLRISTVTIVLFSINSIKHWSHGYREATI